MFNYYIGKKMFEKGDLVYYFCRKENIGYTLKQRISPYVNKVYEINFFYGRIMGIDFYVLNGINGFCIGGYNLILLRHKNGI